MGRLRLGAARFAMPWRVMVRRRFMMEQLREVLTYCVWASISLTLIIALVWRDGFALLLFLLLVLRESFKEG